MNANEPVAWINRYGDEGWLNWDEVKGEGWTATPLYTHPASLVDWSYQQGYQVGKETHPAKTLTDEEIYEVWRKAMQEEAKIEYSIYATQLERQPFLYFARAILRKAQEK